MTREPVTGFELGAWQYFTVPDICDQAIARVRTVGCDKPRFGVHHQPVLRSGWAPASHQGDGPKLHPAVRMAAGIVAHIRRTVSTPSCHSVVNERRRQHLRRWTFSTPRRFVRRYVEQISTWAERLMTAERLAGSAAGPSAYIRH